MARPQGGALRLTHPDVRESVVKRFQAAAEKHPPGTEKHERANLAVMLALSPKRNASNPAFLTRNCKRDARRIFLHRPHHETHFTDLDQGATAAATGIDDGTEFDPIENRLPNRRQPTPDEVAIANESETRVRTAVSGLPYGEECFEALLAGEPIADTAARLGVEPHTVARVRANIRERASRVLA